MGRGGNDEHGHAHGGHDEPEEPAVPAAEMAANMKANTPPSFYYKRVTALLVAAIVIALVVPSAGTHSNAAEVGVHKVITNTVLLSLTALAIIAVSFEMGNHHLHHHTEDIFKPVLHAINSELMSVGFLAVIFYFMLKFKLLIKASESTICQNCDPCNNGGCTATKLKSSLTNSYWKSTNHSALTDGYIVKPGSPGAAPGSSGRRLLDELNDEEIVNTMLWRMGHVSSPPPLSDVTTRRLHARRLAGGPAVPRAVGSWDANPAKVSYAYYASGKAKWKDLVGATSCDATAGTGNRPAGRRLSVEERHRAAWGAENWDRLQGARRRLGGASNPMYTCECKDCDTKLILLWENVHMGLFLCLVLYFIRSIVLLGQTQKIAKKWKRTEAIIQTKGIKAMVQNYYDVHDHAVDQEGLDSVARAHAEEDMEYLMLRTRFVKTGNGGAPLENDFSFAEYLSILFAHTAAHVVHIPPAAWVVLELFFILFWAAMNGAPKIRIRIFVLYVSLGFGFLALLVGKMKAILDQLTAQWPAPTGKKYVVTDELVETLANVKPAYLDADSVGGQQQKLFWFHGWGHGFGPAFLMHMIRLMTLVQIIFAVLMINAVPFAQSYDSKFLGILIAIFVPLLASNYYLPPMLLKLQTLITSIELTKNPHAIEETIRTVKFSKSIRTIKLLKSLQSVAAMSKSKAGEPGPKKVLGPETDEELERKVQMKEVFAMFDESGDGEVDLEEMSGLMSSVGVSFSDEDKLLMMRDFDSSGDGTISFEEFWQYMRQMAVPSDPQQIVEDVFSLIDKDGSGSITAQEFSDQMKALPCEISEHDIESLVREVDHSGDGEIDLHEFAAVLKKYV